jgi:16S rRNA G966 N2-methylase RsmD
MLTKKSLNKVFESVYDFPSSQVLQVVKYIPALISYDFGKKRYYKKPDQYDTETIERIQQVLSRFNVPIFEIPKGDKTMEALNLGIKYHHQFYFDRSLLGLIQFAERIKEKRQFVNISSTVPVLSKLYRFRSQGGSFGAGGGPMNGVIYFPSIIKELPVFKVIKEHLIKTYKVKRIISNPQGLITTQSMSSFPNFNSDSVDYIFTDPPFGANLMYSELNFMRESWLCLFTNNIPEAIENKSQNKNTLVYQEIMTKCFGEYFRILKPNKWMTVEFSNTSAAVWNGIQIAIQRAGFIIANLASIDKQQGSYNAVNNPTSVRQDLVISCYKPSNEFGKKFDIFQGDVAVWNFVLEHLNHLPVHISIKNNTTAVIERSPKILFDRLITFYITRGLSVPIDAKDFQDGLKQRFVERDSMYFTAEQAAEYDEKKAKAPQFVQLSFIVTNESDAIEWLKERLRKKSQKYQDIMPDFRIATQSLRKGDTLPELQDILNENFIQESDGRWRTPDPNEAKDREALRTKVLLKEFNGYVTAINQPRAKKLKEVRVEALRAGFKNCWEQKDFKTIITLGDMIPQNILLEDEQLLMYYDIAKDRV